MAVPHRTKLPVVAGVVTIVSACFWFILNAIAFSEVSPTLESDLYAAVTVSHLVLVFLITAIGAVGGIMSLMRRNYFLATVGATFMLFMDVYAVPGLVVLIPDYPTSGSVPLFLFRIMDVPIFLLQLVSLIFIARSKEEFS